MDLQLILVLFILILTLHIIYCQIVHYMQLQQGPLLNSSIPNRYALSANKNVNSRFIQQANPAKRSIYLQNPNGNKGSVNTRGLTPTYNRVPNIRESSINGYNKNVDINLNINVNNDGAVNPPTFNHSGLPKTQQFNNQIPVPNFRIPPQPIQSFGSIQVGQPQPQIGYPQRLLNLPQHQAFYNQFGFPGVPQPIFIGHRNISNPEPTKNIVPQQQKPIILQIEQEKVHCVLCDCDYLVSDHQQHKKKHQRQRQETTKIKKLVKEYKKFEDPQVRPIVQPQEYNIQYQPNSFVIEEQKKFHTLAVQPPSQKEIGIDANTLNQKKQILIVQKQKKREQEIHMKQQKPIQAPVAVQMAKPPPENVRLTIDDQKITPFERGLFLTQRIARQSNRDSIKMVNSLKDNRQRFERQTFIPEQQGELNRFNNDSIMKQSLQNEHYRLSDNQQSIKSRNLNLAQNNTPYIIESKPIEKVELSMQQFGNFSRVDSSAYRSGAIHSRKLNAGYESNNSFKKPSQKQSRIPVYEQNSQSIHEVIVNGPSEKYQQNIGFLSSISRDLNNSLNSRKQAIIHQQPYRQSSRQNSTKGLLAAEENSFRQPSSSDNHNITGGERFHHQILEQQKKSIIRPKQEYIDWQNSKHHQETPQIVTYPTNNAQIGIAQKKQINIHAENSINNETSHFPQESNQNSKLLENSNQLRNKQQNPIVEQSKTSSINNSKKNEPIHSYNDPFASNILLGIKKADESYQSSIGYKDKIEMPLQILDDSKESQTEKRKKLPKYVGGW